MSDFNHPTENSPEAPGPEQKPALTVIPIKSAPLPPAPARSSGILPLAFGFLLMVLFLSLGLNVFLFLVSLGGGAGGGISLREQHYSGNENAKDRIAIITMDGVIMEGMLDFVHKQIKNAAADDSVKAVVLRINSPGGSITASDDLHRRLQQLRDGTTPGHRSFKKPIVVSMGSLAASGGYYISMPAQKLFAERSTITGSIGVYAAFPTIAEFAEKHGFGMNIIKAGEVKASGSIFKKMTPEEQQVWQDMVDQAFDQFLSVVAEGRPNLTKEQLREVVIEKPMKTKNDKGAEIEFVYTRRRADGGIFTAEQALQFGLIDQIGYLDDAIAEAAKLAGISDYEAFHYTRPPTLIDLLTASQNVPATAFEPKNLPKAACPRLWFLAPQSELAGILAAARSQ
ncbi:MAG: hypothetical protein KatS3mg105_3869 [Gemmatales bacterium]|nr:MAG: hypothetical protein KatS3mg105_3869 [Gemmatales bacterium]